MNISVYSLVMMRDGQGSCSPPGVRGQSGVHGSCWDLWLHQSPLAACSYWLFQCITCIASIASNGNSSNSSMVYFCISCFDINRKCKDFIAPLFIISVFQFELSLCRSFGLLFCQSRNVILLIFRVNSTGHFFGYVKSKWLHYVLTRHDKFSSYDVNFNTTNLDLKQ